ncbi:N-acetylmuramoyl-L-alanine amidase [Clostridium sp. DSM 8431]|uniref:peptidoglycan recognition protein family protein n=1 Tax=Clostridium sp. DSM 8431 TaxID=1761781 RepID=UPI0008F0188D|nr:peptidoglycan recognition family protein [Clostridium sp. DSM 8431]SFU29121.1 N-acetylmuramoyl-L-alanine amidase [Clostridium sp. DSM 8431]
MLNVQRLGRDEFERIMKRRRIRTCIFIVFIIMLFIYVVGVKSYEYAVNKSYCKYLINMDSGNYDIEKLREKKVSLEKQIDIKNIDYKLGNDIEVGNKPKTLIIHHTAANGLTPDNINEDHKSKGYGGIGYHFYIRKDGSIYRGRPEDYIGAHTIGRNYDSIGICVEGNFEDDVLPTEEERSLILLSADMVIKYNISDIIGHRDAYQTLCPGENISIEDIKEKVKEEILKMDNEYKPVSY